jgi:hypothetical protein
VEGDDEVRKDTNQSEIPIVPKTLKRSKRVSTTPQRYREAPPKAVQLKCAQKKPKETDYIGVQVDVPSSEWPDYEPQTSAEYKVSFFRAEILSKGKNNSYNAGVYSNDPTRPKMIPCSFDKKYIVNLIETNPVKTKFSPKEWLEWLANPINKSASLTTR